MMNLIGGKDRKRVVSIAGIGGQDGSENQYGQSAGSSVYGHRHRGGGRWFWIPGD